MAANGHPDDGSENLPPVGRNGDHGTPGGCPCARAAIIAALTMTIAA
jgi:hypothetical protein